MKLLSVRVVRKAQEAIDITSFELAPLAGEALPDFTAGAHIDVHIPGGLIRQYSLSNDPASANCYRIAVLRDPKSRGGSLAMHDHVLEGDVISISAPKNHFPLSAASNTLLFAGGIGVTPLLSMAQRLHALGARFAMHYCARSAARLAFREEIAASPLSPYVHLHVDEGTPEQRLDINAILAACAPHTHLYVCGPSGFIEHVVNAAQSCGWAKDCIHFEYFGGVSKASTSDEVFEVKLASTGQSFSIPADKSVVEVLAEHGIDIPTSCEQGVCGTCITRILDGTPEHRDTYFTDGERALNNQFTPCCSRAKSAQLVLDL